MSTGIAGVGLAEPGTCEASERVAGPKQSLDSRSVSGASATFNGWRPFAGECFRCSAALTGLRRGGKARLTGFSWTSPAVPRPSGSFSQSFTFPNKPKRLCRISTRPENKSSPSTTRRNYKPALTNTLPGVGAFQRAKVSTEKRKERWPPAQAGRETALTGKPDLPQDGSTVQPDSLVNMTDSQKTLVDYYAAQKRDFAEAFTGG